MFKSLCPNQGTRGCLKQREAISSNSGATMILSMYSGISHAQVRWPRKFWDGSMRRIGPLVLKAKTRKERVFLIWPCSCRDERWHLLQDHRRVLGESAPAPCLLARKKSAIKDLEPAQPKRGFRQRKHVDTATDKGRKGRRVNRLACLVDQVS